uniref:Uncharacterized protein n=1 Tax=Avena sativa TaxID=4498 RepID=A0ACD5YH21_AVESA
MMMKLGCSPLLLSGHLLLYLSATLLLATADVAAGQRPGCPSQCGDVDIPFPFGIGDQCALHSGFNLSCTTVNGTTKPFAGIVEVTNISVAHGTAWMNARTLSWRCSFPSTDGTQTQHFDGSLNLTYTPYWVSEVENKIIVIGCNTLAYMMSSSYVSGCYSTCANGNLENGVCSGAGCCQADAPKGMRSFSGYFNEAYNTTSQYNSPCSYMVLMKNDTFRFKTSYVDSTVFYDAYNGTVPIVLNWEIHRTTCEVAMQNMSSYACISINSECLNSANGKGHRCVCSHGYEGNPYIMDGCKDIDECLANPNPCGLGICRNTLGNYSCSCHQGYYVTNGVCIIRDTHFPVVLSVSIGIGSGAGLLLLVLGVIFVTRKLKHRRANMLKQKFFKQNRGHILEQLVSQKADIAERMIIPLVELEKATDNFDKAREIGGGGHGTVYKGIMTDLHVVAIKKSKVAIQREIDEFINEVAILSQINHRNVVKLFGCCLETEVPLLVYEFISNGTLYQHIHVEGADTSLSWVDRLRIATETARALAYLHSAVSFPVVHRDIKSQNILLDGTLVSKVSDFGASRCIPVDQTGNTTSIQGTFGYLDPMYYYSGRLTEKSDVYSFGVLLMELLTRKKPCSYRSSDGESLVAYFTALLAAGDLTRVLDPQVVQEGDKEVEEVAVLAAACVRMEGDHRPTMRQVEMRLESFHIRYANVVMCDTYGPSYPAIKVTNTEEVSRQYSLEEEYLLSSRYPR